MTAHSPGPWRVGTWRSSDDYGWTVDLGGDQRVVIHAQSAESEANVDLIAAAPELLEALGALMVFHPANDLLWEGAAPDYRDAVLSARAAIANATGGKP